MQAIVSTIGTPPYGISQYLVKLIQPTLNKSKYKIANSSSFLNHARFNSKEQSRDFQKILNKQDKHIQFIIEDENEEKCLNFLDIKANNSNRRYEFDVHRKPALTKVQIKPHSCITPDTITSIFKGFLARATKICSEKYLRAEIQYLADIFCENGHNRKTLQKIINNFEKKIHGTNKNNNNNTNKM